MTIIRLDTTLQQIGTSWNASLTKHNQAYLTQTFFASVSVWSVKTTRKAGGLTEPYKGSSLAAPQGAAFSSFKPSAQIA